MQVIIIVLVAVAAVGAVIYPMLSSGRGRDFSRTPPAEGPDLDAAVERYRASLRAGTLCLRCGWANPAGSAYCSDCGEPLIAAELPLQDESVSST